MMDGMIAACDSGNRMTAETPVPVVWNSRWTLSPNRVAKTVNGVTTQYLVENGVFEIVEAYAVVADRGRDF